MVEKLTFGSDPEFFFLKEGQIVPPVFLLGEGERIIWKEEFPYRVYKDEEELSVTSDGAAFELVVRPKENWEELFDLIGQGISITKDLVKKKDVEIAVLPAAEINPQYLVDETLISGCDPDYDALDEDWCAKEVLEDSPYRYAGAHMHIGFQDSDMRAYAHNNIIPLVQLLGIYVGIPALINSKEKQLEALRLKKYGKPARYRVPDHGVEYRSTSNNWIINRALAGTLFENVQKVVEVFKNPERGRKILDAYLTQLSFGFAEENLPLLKTVYNDAIKLI